jgi:hypothetical protein
MNSSTGAEPTPGSAKPGETRERMVTDGRGTGDVDASGVVNRR